MTTKTVLVPSASGQIGSHLVPALLRDNFKLVLPTSNAQKLKTKLPANASNVFVEEGDITSAPWVENIVKTHNVDTVFVCFSGPTELIVTLNFLDALQRAGTVKHIVYLSAAGDLESPAVFDQVIAGNSAAHVLIKPLLERKLKVSGYPWTTVVVGPTYFWYNDYQAKEAVIHHNFFAVPTADIGSSRVAPSDIAAVVRAGIVNPEKWAGKKINVGSLHNYTRAETAKLWSDALGRQINVMGTDEQTLTQWEQTAGPYLEQAEGKVGKAWTRDLRLMFHAFANYNFGLTPEQYKVTVEALGREPLKYDDFVAKTAKEWSSS